MGRAIGGGFGDSLGRGMRGMTGSLRVVARDSPRPVIGSGANPAKGSPRSPRRSDKAGAVRRTSSAKEERTGRGGGSAVVGSLNSKDSGRKLSLSVQLASGSGATLGNDGSTPPTPG